AVYSQFFSLLLVIAHWLSLQMLDRKDVLPKTRNVRRWIALLVSPVLLFVATTGTGPLRWVQRPKLEDLWDFALNFAGNGGTWLLLAFSAALLAGLLPGLRPPLRVSWEAWRLRFLGLWLLFPIALTLGISLVKPLFVPRYFIFCLPALLLLVSCGV